MIKQKRGYSLGVLVITIAVIIILTTIILMSFKSMTGDKEITNFMNDLSEVEEYVREYYSMKHVLPLQYDDTNMPIGITDLEYENIRSQSVESDAGNYYHVDLNKLERLHLQDKNRGYVVNEGSLKIYVINPISFQGVDYYTITDELRGTDKTYNDSVNFEILISGNPINWVSKAKLILSIPDLISSKSGDSFIGDGWTFKYSENGPVTAEEFKNRGKLFLYGETVEVSQNGIVSFYIENPEGYVKVKNVVISMIDDVAPIIKLDGDNTSLRKINN